MLGLADAACRPGVQVYSYPAMECVAVLEGHTGLAHSLALDQGGRCGPRAPTPRLSHAAAEQAARPGCRSCRAHTGCHNAPPVRAARSASSGDAPSDACARRGAAAARVALTRPRAAGAQVAAERRCGRPRRRVGPGRHGLPAHAHRARPGGHRAQRQRRRPARRVRRRAGLCAHRRAGARRVAGLLPALPHYSLPASEGPVAQAWVSPARSSPPRLSLWVHARIGRVQPARWAAVAAPLACHAAACPSQVPLVQHSLERVAPSFEEGCRR